MGNNTKLERLVIAAYRLPFKFIRQKNRFKAIQNSGGLVSAVLALSENFKKSKTASKEKILWAGIADNPQEIYSSNKPANSQFDIVPVNISPELDQLFYGGFCNDLIWPLFHYFPSFAVFNDEYYESYKEANAIFCEELIKFIKPGDFIWVHDYQLMLLPEMLREKMPDAKIGFFLHIPFPSYEIFRILPRPWRTSIINGLLGSDLIGFHTPDYAQYFINSVKRVTDFECNENIIFTPNRIVKADAFPIGIDYDKFHESCNKVEVQKEILNLSKILSGHKLIFSVDRLDYSKGLLLKLQGYEKFLETYPEWQTKVIFNMVVVPSRDTIDKYKEMKTEIESTVGRINGKYNSLAWTPIIYQYKSLSFDEMIALYSISNVGLITPLRDGMNLVAKEYIACQTTEKGVLVLSEMTGAAAELTEAIMINPFDKIEMAEAIYDALEMKAAEKKARIDRMQKRISSYNVFTWAFDFFTQAFETKERQKKMEVKLINKNISSLLISDYKKGKKRILFLDYDGTLVPFAKFPELAKIDKNTLSLIKKLAGKKENLIVIISGRGKDFLVEQFDDLNICLVAEHGYFIRKQGMNWEEPYRTDNKWKEAVLPILNDYVNRCNGTFIEEKTGSLAWHYRNADAEFAKLRLNELKEDLAEIARHKTEIEILEGKKVLEVKNARYDKGKAAIDIMGNDDYDFIFAAGDDRTDEHVFNAMPENAYTIRVGNHPSLAKYNVADFPQLLNLLSSMAEIKN